MGDGDDDYIDDNVEMKSETQCMRKKLASNCSFFDISAWYSAQYKVPIGGLLSVEFCSHLGLKNSMQHLCCDLPFLSDSHQ